MMNCVICGKSWCQSRLAHGNGWICSNCIKACGGMNNWFKIRNESVEEIRERVSSSASSPQLVPKNRSRKYQPGKTFSTFAMVGMLSEGEKKESPRFKIGDHVPVRYRGQEGTIVNINGEYYMVSLASGCDSYKESQLEKAW